MEKPQLKNYGVVPDCDCIGCVEGCKRFEFDMDRWGRSQPQPVMRPEAWGRPFPTPTSAPAEIYMVLGPLGAPRVKHNSKSSAQAEAQRLAKAKPGQKFYVLRAITEYEAEATTIISMKSKAI